MNKDKRHYALRVEVKTDGDFLYIWKSKKEKGYEQVAYHDISIMEIASLTYQKYKNLAISGDWVYMTYRETAHLLHLLKLPAIPPEKCPVCAPHFKGYIPLSSFYTGCPECNPEDNSRYTAFELNDKITEEDELIF